MLTAYQTRTAQLLQNPAAPTPLYATADLTSYINQARLQLAGEAVCVRSQSPVSTVAGQPQYSFSAVNLGTPATTGIQSVLNISNIRYTVGAGTLWIETRPWPWFSFYHLNNPVPQQGPPTTWSQYSQGGAGGTTGSGASGSFYIDPVPDQVYTLTCDCICLPQLLALDSDVEAIPYPWTDAVPFLAAWYALLASQTNARVADAERMYNYYETYKERARQAANPDLLRWQYSQGADIAQGPKFGIKPGAGGGAT